MNSFNFNDNEFMQSEMYKKYIRENNKVGYLSIRAYAANKALPIEGLNVVVYKVIDNNRIIFYEGKTDNSGLIEKISLPAPEISNDDLVKPASQEYTIEANYDNQNLLFFITMYENISVNQNINVVPIIRLDGSSYGG